MRGGTATSPCQPPHGPARKGEDHDGRFFSPSSATPRAVRIARNVRRNLTPHSQHQVRTLPHFRNPRRTHTPPRIRFVDEAARTHLIGPLLLELEVKATILRARYMALSTIAPLHDSPTLILQIAAA
ncbi:hypothetical protein DF3PB_240011 [uncultured Defluviicoccus sp.]|uniref:Uncharacterized protein n=1 Tax=metagenome TaxID=256318 RepID=A0A380TD98_9ZZZZ|nr:hypothetical protein DF3PB_240011 [uncultured Defluviicoccus sp.]